MPLPQTLREAISAPNGGQVVLILGAGCSVEPPTSLPMSYDCSIEAHRRLVEDGVLVAGECPNPGDLSVLADTVWEKTGSQFALVRRLPWNDFLLAKANEGYLLAAAMLREHAILAVLTLNFDVAATDALIEIGGREVIVLNGPEAGRAGVINLIYLHRNAHSDDDAWILRTASLRDEWQGQWEEIITQRVMAATVSVFVGLGSPAGVLTATVTRIRNSNVHSTPYVVGPGPAEHSRFLELLGLGPDQYIQSSWGGFMAELSARVVEEHRAGLVRACSQLAQANAWQQEDVTNLCARIAQLGLLEIGRLRAIWFLNKESYLPLRGLDVQLWADLVLVIALIERMLGMQGRFVDGVLEFNVDDRIVGSIAFASGRGTRRWLAIETDLKQKKGSWVRRGRPPSCAVITGAIGSAQQPATPLDLVDEHAEDDIVDAAPNIKMISAYDLRDYPDRIREMMN